MHGRLAIIAVTVSLLMIGMSLNAVSSYIAQGTPSPTSTSATNSILNTTLVTHTIQFNHQETLYWYIPASPPYFNITVSSISNYTHDYYAAWKVLPIYQPNAYTADDYYAWAIQNIVSGSSVSSVSLNLTMKYVNVSALPKWGQFMTARNSDHSYTPLSAYQDTGAFIGEMGVQIYVSATGANSITATMPQWEWMMVHSCTDAGIMVIIP